MIDQWEVRWIDARRDEPILPEGWEPFAAVSGGLWLRRRMETVSVSHGRGRTLSAQEVAARRRQVDERIVARGERT